MSDNVGKGLIGFCLVGYGWLLRHFLGWNWWAAFAVACVAAFITGFCAYAIRDTWPLEVPCDLIDRVDELTAQGWRTARVHPWWHCELKRPHVHMVNPRAVKIARQRVILEDTTIAQLRLP